MARMVAGALLSLLLCTAALASGRQKEASVVLAVRGMMCASCAAQVEKALKGLDGVGEVRVDLRTDRVEVGYAPEWVTPRRMVEALRKEGYGAERLRRERPTGPGRAAPR